MSEQLSKHFTLAELCRTGTGLPNDPNPSELEALRYLVAHVLQPLRDRCGRLRVSSGYRSPPVNAAVGGAKGSQHVRGEAADIIPLDITRDELWAVVVEAIRAGELPIDQAIRYDDAPHVHLSATSRRRPRGELLERVQGAYRHWHPTDPVVRDPR